MKRLFLLVLVFPNMVFAQWHLNLFGGISNYSGDLQGKVFTMDQSNAGFGIGLQYDFTPHVSALSGVYYGKVGASDKFNKPILQQRNLSFQTQIFEWNLMGEYNLFDLSVKRFTPYGFAGIAVFHFNPYAYDTLGNKVYLRPLSTEGEGLAAYPDRKPYSLFQFAIPFGAGIKIRITDNVVLAYEVSFRKLFTDYLDDVSTKYVDSATLAQAKGPLAIEMSYRGNEVKGGNPNYPAAGTVRGNPKNKDWYYFTGIRVSIGLDNMINKRMNKKGIIDCPKKVM
ncbi:MAG: outer membrane beta-barrel protein [Bacteroidetes bacterium]|nr:outer membrane beta-barrel protein [Bacteroidota bacterium]MBS1973393.1 outer membrane beta-barrel protein [Bacteroidota bacterium]